MPDLTINSVSVPAIVASGTAFSLDVNVTALADSMEDGSAYRLFVFVNSLLAGGLLVLPPITLQGHLGEAPWTTANHLFQIPVTAGAGPDVYNITAVLLEGHGIDPDGAPSLGFAGPVVVV